MKDYHLHSHLCNHGEGEIYEYVESAISKDLEEIGFAEHIPIPDLDDPTGRMVCESFPEYLRQVADAQARYPEIKIRLGLEADYIPEHLDYISGFIKSYSFDFVIGSIHYVDGWDMTNTDNIPRIRTIGVNRVYRSYYRLLAEAAASGLFDIIGHFDAPKKFGYLPDEDISDAIEAALAQIQKNNLALDINTAGLRRNIREVYPSRAILERAFQRGIPVVLGSDAHSPSDVAWGFESVLEMLWDIGYRRTSSYEKRKRRDVPITKGHSDGENEICNQKSRIS